MNIHICTKVKMGFPKTIVWRQEKVCVPYWRVYWNDAPGAFVKDASGEIELTPGHVVAIPPRTVYSTRTSGGSTHFYVHFTAEPPYASVQPGILRFDSPQLVRRAKEIAAELTLDPPSARTLVKTQIYLYELLLLVPPEKLPNRLDPRIEKALALMDEDPGVSVAELARALAMGRTTFLRLFLRETGSTPQRLSRKKRLEKACMLLHFSEKTLQEIAEETGFCDRYHLSKMFKREYNYGPATFRRQIGLITDQPQ